MRRPAVSKKLSENRLGTPQPALVAREDDLIFKAPIHAEDTCVMRDGATMSSLETNGYALTKLAREMTRTRHAATRERMNELLALHR